MPDKIPGGFYLKARCIQNSEVAHFPPHVREIWDWLIKEANYQDCKTEGKTISRGQCLTSYKEIRDALSWRVGYRTERYSKNDCETAMKMLTNHTMVHTTKTTRGMIVTILNYDKYQNPENYEAYNETYKKHTMNIQSTDTIRKEREESKEETHTSSEQNSDDAFCVPKSNCPHQEIINLYHQKLPSLPAVKEWTPKRQALLRSRWSEKEERQNLEWWESFFDTVAASDFLTGKVGTFRASLEWLVRPTNFIKVIEDNYKNRNGSGHHESRPLPKDPEAEARLLALYGES